MIDLKTKDEIEKMRVGGRILSNVLREVIGVVKPGVTELELDQLAEKRILEQGGKPGFKLVDGYSHTICVSVNEVVVHGVPTNNKLKAGDVIGIDCGVFFQGYHTDMSETVRVGGEKGDEIDAFLNAGKLALKEGIKAARLDNRVGDISNAIQEIVEKKNSYSVVRSLVGHGVGKSLHEEPEVPGYVQGTIAKTPKLKEGMTIAIEVIYNMGGSDVVYRNDDGWTIKTKDNSISGVFERTVAISRKGPFVLTQ